MQPEASKWVADHDQTAVDMRAAVRTGDVAAIEKMLRADPALARARLGSKESGSATPLHLIATGPAISRTVRRSLGC